MSEIDGQSDRNPPGTADVSSTGAARSESSAPLGKYFAFPGSAGSGEGEIDTDGVEPLVSDGEEYSGENPFSLSEARVGFILSSWQFELTVHATNSQRVLAASAKLTDAASFDLINKDGSFQSMLGLTFWVRLHDIHPSSEALADKGAMGSFSTWDENSVGVSAIIGPDRFSELTALYTFGRLDGALLVVSSRDLASVGTGEATRWDRRKHVFPALTSVTLTTQRVKDFGR